MRDPDESPGTLPYKNVHTFNILYLIPRESWGPKEVHPIPQVKNPENENMTALQFGVAEL